MGSVEFSKFLIREAQVAVSPGIGFGEYGDDYVRFALIENNMRINQARAFLGIGLGPIQTGIFLDEIRRNCHLHQVTQ